MVIPLSQGTAVFYPELFEPQVRADLYQALLSQVQWRQDYLRFYGKSVPIPRLQAWYGDVGAAYTYSGVILEPLPWIQPLQMIRHIIEPIAGVQFNSVLINLYRDGNDGVAWHSDDEPELGEHPVIGSVSLGGTRRFMLKPKDKTNPERHELALSDGSLLLMSGETQKYWVHQVPKTKKPVLPRINLTFRVIQGHST